MEPARLQSMGSQRVRHNWMTNTFTLISLDGQISLPSAEPRAQLGEGKKMKKKWAWLACGGVKGADGSSESNAGEGGTKQYWGKDYAPGVGRAASNLLRSLWTIDLGSPVSVSSFINFAWGKLLHFWPWDILCVCVCVCVSVCLCVCADSVMSDSLWPHGL